MQAVARHRLKFGGASEARPQALPPHRPPRHPVPACSRPWHPPLRRLRARLPPGAEASRSRWTPPPPLAPNPHPHTPAHRTAPSPPSPLAPLPPIYSPPHTGCTPQPTRTSLRARLTFPALIPLPPLSRCAGCAKPQGVQAGDDDCGQWAPRGGVLCSLYVSCVCLNLKCKNYAFLRDLCAAQDP